MDAAWEQIGDVLAANRVVRWGQLALAASSRLYTQQLEPLARVSADRALALTAPLHSRVLSQGATILHAIGAERSATSRAFGAAAEGHSLRRPTCDSAFIHRRESSLCSRASHRGRRSHRNATEENA